MIEIDIQTIEEDYEPVFDIFSEEDEKIYRLKWIIKNVLTEPERRIILLYSELQSQRKTAVALDCSVPTLIKKIRRIKAKIKDELKKHG